MPLYLIIWSSLMRLPSLVWAKAKRLPAWSWGVLIGALAFLVMWLRMRAAEKARFVAEGRAAGVQAKVKIASHEARAELHQERADAFAAERKQTAEATEAKVERILNLRDNELSAWLKADAAKRRKP